MSKTENPNIQKINQEQSHLANDDIAMVKQDLTEVKEKLLFLSKQISSFYESVSSFRTFVNSEQIVQTNYISDLHLKIEKIDQSVASIPNIFNKLSNIKKLDAIEEKVDNIDYNIKTSAFSESNNYKEVIEKKLSDYEEDLYMKLMRKYIVDSHISLYIQVNERSRILDSDKNLKQVLDMIISKLHSLGIKEYSSKPGDEFNPIFMTTGHYPNISTNDMELDGKVAESICPMFKWVLPNMNQKNDYIILKEEEVTLFQFISTNNNNK